MKIRQLIYRSEKASSLLESEIQLMLNNFKAPNTTHEITGMLFYIEGYFIQCIEGSEENVEQLLSNIIRDPRNTNLTILSDSTVTERRFPTWWMGYKSMSANELMHQKGFVDISSKETLERLLSHHQKMLSLMIDYYDSV